MESATSTAIDLETQLRNNKSLVKELNEEWVRLDEEFEDLNKSIEILERVPEPGRRRARTRVELNEHPAILKFQESIRIRNLSSQQDRRECVLASRNDVANEYKVLVDTIDQLNGKLFHHNLFAPKVNISKCRIVWRLETFRAQTQISKKCWIDPLQLVNINGPRFIRCVIYVKYLRERHQAVGMARVCKTLLMDKQIEHLEIIHYVDNKTQSCVDTTKEIMMIDPDGDFAGKAQDIIWTTKDRDEVHMRRMYFYTDKSQALANTDTSEELAIICDRDFCDIGDPTKGSRETNFLYIQPSSQKQQQPEWEIGYQIEVPHSNTGCEMVRFLERIFGTHTDLGQEIEMSFRHIQEDSQQLQLETLVKFCQDRGVEIVNIKTMLRSERSDQFKHMTLKQKNASNKTELDQQTEFKKKFPNIQVNFITNTKRYGDHSNSLYCPKASIKLISDEGLQVFKADDAYNDLQRPRAFSLFVLEGFKQLGGEILSE